MRVDADFEYVGELGVDSGTIMVGDPCYTLPDERKWNPETQKMETQQTFELSELRTYGEFLKVLETKTTPFEDVQAPWGTNGMPLIIDTLHGDGAYGVYVKRGQYGRPAQILIDFEGEPDEDEDEDECVCEHCGATIDSLELSVNNGFCDTCAADQSFYYCSDCQCDISFSMWRDNDGYCDDCAAANE